LTGESQTLASLYRETVLTNAAAPHGHLKPITPTHQAELDNPLCGDRILMQLELEGDHIANAAFEGEACAICLASASLLCRHMPGQDKDMPARSLAAFNASLGHDEGDCPEFLRAMRGVAAYPMRIACAALPWEAAIEAITGPSRNSL
jgi:nitrogen fixation NifU-like protein